MNVPAGAWAFTFAVAVAAAGRAEAAGDTARGEALFKACALCHTLEPDGGNRAGPTLWGVFGRQAGAVPDYPYSEALAASGIIWTGETIARLFEVGPDILTPGSKMPVQRLPDPEDRADLVAFLRQATSGTDR